MSASTALIDGSSRRKKNFLLVVALLLGVVSGIAVGSPSFATAPPDWSAGQFAVFADGVVYPPTNGVWDYSEFQAVACASAGNCTAVGRFRNANNRYETFTMTSTNGVWGQATPTTFANGVQSATPSGYLTAVACASPGNCTAVGRFENTNNHWETFTVTSTNGVWGQATPTTFANGVQSATPFDFLDAVTCTSPGNCIAVGSFQPASGGNGSAFTVTSTNGVWSDAVPVEFPAGTQHASPTSYLESVSCASVGNCTAVGQFRTVSNPYAAFAVSSTNGVWSAPAQAVFAAGVQSSSPYSGFTDVSCAAAGQCAAVGYFVDVNGTDRAFTMTSTNGTWNLAEPVTFADGVAGASPYSTLEAIDCATTLVCAAVGHVGTRSRVEETYVIEMVDGVWQPGDLIDFPAGVRNQNPSDEPHDISCPSVGYCTAVGDFSNALGDTGAFAVDQLAGTWQQAHSASMPDGTQNANPYHYLVSVACPTAGNCTAVGNASDGDGDYRAFTLSSTYTAPVSSTTTVPSTAVLPPALPALVNTPAATTPTTTAPPEVTAPPITTTPVDTAPPATEPTTTTLPAPALSVVRELPPAPTPIVADPTFALGGQVVVTFGGFTPFEYVQLIVASTPQVIGSGYADAQGVVTLSGNLPADLASGAHTVAVYAPASGVGFSQPIEVTAPQLPATGSVDPTVLYLVAVVLVAIGLAVARPRRRV